MFVRQLFLRMVKRPITTVVEGPVLISPIQRRPDGGIRFQLHVKPGAKRSRVTDIGEQSIGVQIAAPPRDGEANEEVVKYMAEALGVKVRQVELAAGHKSRDKVIVIRLDANDSRTAADFQAKLQYEIDA